ncbi:hypothetical protein MUB18_14545 [Sphingobacterium sp. PCS056]|uniref:hypothetical protein n=1 Tax=Sphingobacterium sp. PCS056 TaxID=2931400 RepID=UPI00200C1C31|nr:hypothetical protein [Sphingobacterium sp. PCS056]UPZ35326.1 hypothetical protein MUB18_14545 [Sphingobacterium sp. PCS056]
MKKMKFLFGAIMSIILASACGNSTNHNENNMDSMSTDTTMQRDTMMPDTSMIQYRDSNSTESSNGVIPPTS